MTKKKFLWVFSIILAAATVLTVAVTLGVCFSAQEELCAPGFTYTGFYDAQVMGDASYMFSPTGDLLAMEDTYSYRYTSMNKETLVWGWADKTFTVSSKYGVQYVDKTVNRLSYAALFISHDGDAIYFIDNEEFHDSQNSLWRLDVASGHVQKLDTIVSELRGGMVSPGGNYFALMEVKKDGSYIHLYNKKNKVQSYATGDTVQLYFVTDNGTVFYEDSIGGFQSVRETEAPVVYEALQYNLESVLFNRDCTEIIANCTEGGCYFYQLEDDVVKHAVQLKKTGGLAFFADSYELENTTMKLTGNTSSAILDIASFREINLKDVQTGDRVKLTANNTLVYQEGSGYMNGQLVPGGAFLVYTDANGDYFYTDTDDVNGEYKLLLEASKRDMSMLIDITPHKSVYYVDDDNNLHYVKNGKDKVICGAEVWKESFYTYCTNIVEDAIYFTTEDGVYYSGKGSDCRLLFDWGEAMFPDEINQMGLLYAGGQVYCVAWSYDYSTVAFYRLYADGTYQLMKPADMMVVPTA